MHRHLGYFAVALSDMLDFARDTGLPVVLDWLHHKAKRGSVHEASDLLGRYFDTWHERDGLPKLHFRSKEGWMPRRACRQAKRRWI